jgi:hypothetical protein
MENGLNFKPLRLLRQAKEWQTGWNGAGMFAYIVPASTISCYTGVAKNIGRRNFVPYRAYWALKTAQEDVATWAPSGSDSLAELVNTRPGREEKPVNTCPDIDRLIKTVTRDSPGMDFCKEEDTMEDTYL